MLKRFLIISSFLLSASILFSEEIRKDYDPQGRILRINRFADNQLKEIEEYVYTGSSQRPERIIYKSRQGFEYLPYREIEYTYDENRVAAVEFRRYSNGSRIEEGKITFTYENGRPEMIRYFSRLKPSGKLFMFALQQNIYSGDELKTRRFVQYEINPDSLRPMQSSQHVFTYKENMPESMKAWILEQSSQRMIENSEKDLTIIEKIIEDIEERCITISSGNAFNRI